jgi:hypothetical protein
MANDDGNGADSGTEAITIRVRDQVSGTDATAALNEERGSPILGTTRCNTSMQVR